MGPIFASIHDSFCGLAVVIFMPGGFFFAAEPRAEYAEPEAFFAHVIRSDAVFTRMVVQGGFG